MTGKKDYQVWVQKFEMLYEYYQEPIERYLVKWVHDQESACELCQDTFERFWKFLLSQETTSQQTAYYKNLLYKIARNCAIDYLRKTKKFEFLPLIESETDEPKVHARLANLSVEGHEELICEQLYLQEVLAALAAMSPKYRRCFELQAELGLTQRKIAVLLGISESAVSANISRSRERLEWLYTRMMTSRVRTVAELSYKEWLEQFKPIRRELFMHLLAYRNTDIAEHDVPCPTCNRLIAEYDKLDKSSYVVPFFPDGSTQRFGLYGYALLMERIFPVFLIPEQLVLRWKLAVASETSNLPQTRHMMEAAAVKAAEILVGSQEGG